MSEKEVNKLDQQRAEILVATEKRCTKVSSHHLECWSPEIVEAMSKQRYWRTKLTAASKLPYRIGFVQAIEINIQRNNGNISGAI